MDPDPDADPDSYQIFKDPAIFRPEVTFKTSTKFIFFAYYFMNVHLHNFSKIKKSQNRSNQCFSYYFCLMMEGS